MNRIVKFILPVALCCGLLGPAAAGTPQSITYQGSLRLSGAIYTGTLPMEFKITNADGSLVYWTSGSTQVYVSGGLFRYPLGTPGEAEFAAIPWSAAAPFVRVTIGGSALPAAPLLSTPYALYALRSGTAEGAAGSFALTDGDLIISTTAGSRGIIFQNGSVQYTAAGAGLWQTAGIHIYASGTGNTGIGVPNPVYKLDVGGVIRSTGSAYFAASQGSVGIGLTGPSQKLEVAGTVKAVSFSGDGSALTGITAANIVGGSFSDAAYGFPGAVTMSTITVSSITAGDIRITGALGGSVNAGGYKLTNLGAPVSANDAVNKSYVDSATGGGNMAILSATQAFTGLNTFQEQVIVSSDLLVMNGNVGIGMLDPAYRVSVLGGILAASSITALGGFYGDGSGLTNLGAANMPTAISIVNINPGESSSVNITTNIYVAGRAGFGLSNPAEKVEVSGSVKADLLIGSGAQLTNLTAANIAGGSFPGAAYAFPGAVALSTVTASSVTAGNISVTGALGGDLHAGGHRLTNLGAPIAAADAARRAYVDSATGGVGKAAILYSTQTFTGRDTFLSKVTVSSSLFVLGGNFGIGISVPAHKLSVQGGILASSSVTALGGFYGDGSKLTGLSAASLPAAVSVATINASALTPYGGVNITTNVYIAGRAGFGLLNPSEKLEVSGNVKAGSFIGSGAQLTGLPILTIAGGSFANAAYAFPGTVAFSTITVSSITAGNIRIAGALGGNLSAGGHKLTNIAAPVAASDAANKAYAELAFGGSPLSAAVLFATQTFTGQDAFQAQVTVSSNLFILNGRVGIGTLAPLYPLDVAGDINLTGQLRLGGVPASYSKWQQTGPDIYRPGNVGIGTAEPGAALDVAGGAQFGAGLAKSSFTAAGALNMAAGSTITLSGGIITGLPGPAGPSDAANKAYVDGLTGGGQSVAVLPGTQTFTGRNSFQGQVAVSSDLFVVGGNIGIGTAAPGAALDVAGGAQFGAGPAKSSFTAAGALNMAAGSAITLSGGIITGLPGPAGPSDAANKAYVDGLTGGGQPAAVLPGTQTFTGLNSFQGQVTVSSDLYVMGGNIGIGTAEPGAALAVEGGAQFGAGLAKSSFTAAGALNMAAGSAITLSGGIITGLPEPAGPSDAVNKAYIDSKTSGGLPVVILMATQTFTGQNSFLGQVTVSSDLFVTSGSLGIGAAAGAKLEVAGGSVTIRGSDSYPAIAGFADAAGNYKAVISTSGRVGIGTAEPKAALHLSSGIFTAVLFLDDVYGATATVRERRANGTAAAPLPLLSGNIIGAHSFTGYGASGFPPEPTAAMRAGAAENFTDSAQGTWLDFTTTPIGSTTPVTRMKIAADGRVGMGTTEPDYQLQVDGKDQSSARVNAADAGSAYLRLTEEALSDSGGMLKYNGLNDRLEIGTLSGGAEIPAIYIQKNSGNIGIGTTGPAQKLDVNGLVRVGRYTTAAMPACNAAALGSFAFNTTQDKLYSCPAGGAWKPLDYDLDNDGIMDWLDQDDNNSGVKSAGLIPENIKKGVTVFGVTGSLVMGAPSCKAILDAGRSTGDGLYWIAADGADSFQTWCDMTTDGGGWTMVYQNLFSGNEGGPTPTQTATRYGVAGSTNDFSVNGQAVFAQMSANQMLLKEGGNWIRVNRLTPAGFSNWWNMGTDGVYSVTSMNGVSYTAQNMFHGHGSGVNQFGQGPVNANNIFEYNYMTSAQDTNHYWHIWSASTGTYAIVSGVGGDRLGSISIRKTCDPVTVPDLLGAWRLESPGP
ncbi:MAG: fibrinogen-like YCDxxxxGGGW domain-containing protein, partial [Dehalococcoidia bacterium]|nr:fibrinogen-like YCDxxxxGGGW domain-containing protein [Dehalococcoidia bacterium]